MRKLLFFLLIPIWLFGQTLKDCFPIHVGDMWQYEWDTGGITNEYLVKDSTDTLGNHYLFYAYEYPKETPGTIDTFQTWKYKLDTIDNVWIKRNEFNESEGLILELNLDAKIHDWWCMDTSLTYYFANFRWVKDTGYTEDWNKTWRYMVVQSYECKKDLGCNCPPDSMTGPWGTHIYYEGLGRTYTYGEFSEEYLRGAIIDGVEYGDIYRDTTAIKTDVGYHPSAIRLLPAYPNPFNGATVVRYILDRPRRIKAAVYDGAGRRIKTLFNGAAKGGANRLIWKGRNERGAAVSSGMYYIKVSSERFLQTQKVIFIK